MNKLQKCFNNIHRYESNLDFACAYPPYVQNVYLLYLYLALFIDSLSLFTFFHQKSGKIDQTNW